MFKCFKNTLHIDFRHSNKQWIVENRLVLLPSGTVRRLYVLLASSFKEKLFLFMVLYWLFVPSKRNNHEPHSIRNKHKNTGEAVALVSFVDFCFFPMLCKVVVHGLVVQWVRVCYLLVSTLEAVRSRQGERILIWLPVIYLPSFLEEDFFFFYLPAPTNWNQSLILKEYFHKAKQTPNQPHKKYYRETLSSACRNFLGQETPPKILLMPQPLSHLHPVLHSFLSAQMQWKTHGS